MNIGDCKKHPAEFTSVVRCASCERDVVLERDRLMRILESLTPGGSEFVNDPERCVAAIKSARSTLMEKLRDKVKERDRLWDLVRHQRSELHEAELITDEEYAALAQDHASVARLETYDRLRQALKRGK